MNASREQRPLLPAHDPLPTLETARLRLRAPRDDDLEAFFALLSDTDSLRHWSHAPLRTHDDAAWYLRDIAAGRRHGTHLQWAIADRDKDRAIGTTTLFAFDHKARTACVSWLVSPPWRRRGVAQEALRILFTHLASTTSLDALVAEIMPGNAASIALATMLGFDDESARGAEGEHRLTLPMAFFAPECTA